MLRFAIGATALLLTGSPMTSGAQSCDAPERVAGATEYTTLVCEAVSRLRRRDYSAAVRLLDKASSLNLHEYPNFRALPRLALAYARLGDVARARRILDEAAMSLEVAYRMVRCTPSSTDYALVGPGVTRAPPEVVRAVVGRMCGEAFETLYEQSSVESLVGDLPLLEFYRAARVLVGSAPSAGNR